MLTFLIPTRNRPAQLEVAVRSIADQVRTTNVEIIVLDDVSEEPTQEVLSKLKADFPFVSSERMPVHKDYSDTFRRLFWLGEFKDWCWTFGDDDKLQKGALKFMLERLEAAPEELSFIHVAEQRRISGRNDTYTGRLIDLCRNFGWIEMTGFITGNICRGKYLHQAANSRLWPTYAKTAFVQSCALLEVLHDEQAQFLDLPLIDTQAAEQTTETGERWAADRISYRYMLLSWALEAMYDYGILTEKMPPKFFRYLTYHLWDRYITFYIADYINEGRIWQDDWAVHISKFADFVDDEEVANQIRSDVDTARNMVTVHAATTLQNNVITANLHTMLERRNTMPYPYSFLEPHGQKAP